MVTSLACVGMPLDSPEGFAEWAASVCREHGVSGPTIAAMKKGIRENEIDGDMFRMGGPFDSEVREGMGLPELPPMGELPRQGHHRRLLDGLAWRLLHAAAAGRGRITAPAGEMWVWVRRMLPECDDVYHAIGALGGAACELLPEEASLLVPARCNASPGLLARLGRALSCLRSAAAQGCSLQDVGSAEGNVTVCVIGNTGAGKSTLLNSLLGEESLLPTNAMRACTAAIIEIVYNFDFSSSHTAEIRFIPKEEWAAFVREAFQVLLKDQGDEDEDEEMEDGAEKHESLTKQHKSKLFAAYGKNIDLAAGPEALLRKRGPINDNLGKVVTLRATSGKELREKYEQYVDSSNEASEGATWPIVQRVVLKGPWGLLCSGLRLVDAPGLQDDNSARDQVVRSYMQQADSLWLVSNIRRATNDKTTLDMMPAGFIQVLKDKGVPGSLAYIATQTDVMLRSEVIQNLSDRLSETSTQLECALARNNFFKETMAEKISRARGQSEDAEEMRDASEEPDRSRAEGRFDFESFAVSAVDYQKIKGIRQGDGGPAVFRDEEATEIPRLQDFVLQCAPGLREAKFKAKARAALEEEAAMAELELLKNWRAHFQEALEKVDPVGGSMCHGGLLPLAVHTQSTILSLSVAGVGAIGLPLCEQQAAILASTGTTWQGPGGERVSVVEGWRVTLSSGMRELILAAAKKGQEELGLVALARAGVEYSVSSLLVGQKGVPFAAINRAAQCERAFGRMLVQLPCFYESGGKPSVRVVHGGACKEYDFGGGRSGESFFSVAAFSQCTIDVALSTPAVGRGLFLVCDLLKPAIVPGPLPRLADNSEAFSLLRNAVRGMLRDKCEKIAIPLNKSLSKPPSVDALVGKEKAVLQLLEEQSQLEVGFAVVRMTVSRSSGSGATGWKTTSGSTNVHGVDGKDLGFSFSFDIQRGQDQKTSCKDIFSSNSDQDLFQGAHCVDKLDKRHMPMKIHSRVVLMVWPRESTFQLLVKKGRVSSVLKCVQEYVRSKDPTAALALQAVAERFAIPHPKKSRIPNAKEIETFLQLFAESGGLAAEAVCQVIKSLPAIVDRFVDRMKHEDSIGSGRIDRNEDVTRGMRETLLRIVAAFGWEGVKGSFDELAQGLKVRKLNEHVVAVASALAQQGFFEFEGALLKRLISSSVDAPSLRAMPATSAAVLVKAAFTQPRHAALASRLGSSLQHLPSQGPVAAFEHVFSQAFPVPCPRTSAAKELANGALNKCKLLARVILQKAGSAHYGGSFGAFFVKAIVRLNDAELNALCIVQLSAGIPQNNLDMNAELAMRERMLSDLMQGLMLGSVGVSNMESLGPCLGGLGLKVAHSVFQSVRAGAVLKGNSIGPFTQCMFQSMRQKSVLALSSAYGLQWEQVQGLLDIVLPSSGAVRAEDGVTAAVIDDMVHIVISSTKASGLITPIVDLVKRLKANEARCQQHLSAIADTVRRNVTPAAHSAIFISICSSSYPHVKEMIRDFAKPYLDSTAEMCRSLTDLSNICATFCVTRELSQQDRDAFFEKLLPVVKEGMSSQSFIPAQIYGGSRPGFAYKTGESGLGYYKDAPGALGARAQPSNGSLLAQIFAHQAIRGATSKHILELAEMRLAQLKSSPHAQKPAQNVVVPATFAGIQGDTARRIADVNAFIQADTYSITIQGFSKLPDARAWAGKLNAISALHLQGLAEGYGKNAQVFITKTNAASGSAAQLKKHETRADESASQENLKSQTEMASVIEDMRKRVETEAAAARVAPAPPPAPAPAKSKGKPLKKSGEYGLRSASGGGVGSKRAAPETPDTAAKKRTSSHAYPPVRSDMSERTHAFSRAAAAIVSSIGASIGAAMTGAGVGGSPAGGAGAGAGAGALGGAPAAPPPNPPAAGPMVIDLTDD